MGQKRDDQTNKIAELEEAIAGLETALKFLPDEQKASAQANLATLRQKRAELVASIQGSGARAQGEGATAVNERGVAVGGDVGGSIYTGDTYIGTQIVSPAADTAVANLARARQRYLQRLLRHCNVLPLAAMGGEEGAGEEVSLEQVYIALDTRTRIPLEDGEQGKAQPAFRQKQEERAVTALEAATQNRQLVLLGDPGSGKSTFVRQLAARLAAAELGLRPPLPEWEPLLPLVTSLRDLAQHVNAAALAKAPPAKHQQALVTAVQAQWRADLTANHVADLADHLDDWLLDGRVLLILDGLDEVAEPARGQVRQAVRAIGQAYRQDLRIIVTCRIRSYSGDAVLPGFATETLAPFDRDKIRDFVAAWYRAQAALGRLTAAQADDKARDLQDAATAPDLYELSANPMLLTTMALIHQREVGLPRERVRLYALAVQVLLRRWQMRKGVAVSEELAAVLDNPRHIRAILERLGYEAHRQQETAGAGADLSRRDMLALLETPTYLGDVGLAAEFLDYVDQRAGLLVGHGGDAAGQKPPIYSFPHRTFQEYLAGCYLVTGRNPSRNYWAHLGSSDYWYLAAELGSEELLYNNQQGQPYFLDLAYDLCPDRAPDGVAAWRGVVWSGRMATLLPAEVIAADEGRPDGGQAYLNRLRPHLAQALRQPSLQWGERAAAGRSLARLGDTRPQVLTLDQMPLCYVPPGPFWLGSATDDPAKEENEEPQHEVDLAYGYWLAQFPVTHAQFAAFTAAGGYATAAYWPEAIQVGHWQKGQFQGRWDDAPRREPYHWGEPFMLPNHPVVGVTWYEAMAFSRWLTQKWHSLGMLPDTWQVRLPSEAEWEKGARGGRQIPAAPHVRPAAAMTAWAPDLPLAANPSPRRLYPWEPVENGGQPEPQPQQANFEAGGLNSTSAVGCFPGGAGPYGAEEMAGNVWEWTRSRFAPYPYDPADGRESFKSDDDLLILRGDAWIGDARWLFCASRGVSAPSGRDRAMSFRVVCVPILPLDSSPSEL